MADRPVARRTDPGTSWAAAHSVEHVRESQQEVLRVLSLYGAMTDEQLITYVEGQSDSGIRTRRAELVDLGLVRDSGRKVKGATGRLMIVWEISDSPFPLKRTIGGKVDVATHRCEDCGETYVVRTEHQRTFKHRQAVAKAETLESVMEMPPQPEIKMFEEAPAKVDFGSVIPCPRCKGFRRKRKGKLDDFSADPYDTKRHCPRCNGVGVVPNVGPNA